MPDAARDLIAAAQTLAVSLVFFFFACVVATLVWSLNTFNTVRPICLAALADLRVDERARKARTGARTGARFGLAALHVATSSAHDYLGFFLLSTCSMIVYYYDCGISVARRALRSGCRRRAATDCDGDPCEPRLHGWDALGVSSSSLFTSFSSP